jgi:hypothetical protein
VRGHDRDQQRHRPEAEDHLDLAEEVQRLGGEARHARTARRGHARGVAGLHAVRQRGEPAGHERMGDREQEDQRDHGVERIRLDAGTQHIQKRGAR